MIISLRSDIVEVCHSLTGAVLVRAVLALFDLLRYDASVLTGALVDLTFVPMPLHFRLELVAAGAQFGNCLLRQKFLECPFLNILLFVLLQLRDELDSALQDRALVLLAARNNLGELVDALVDGFAAATLHW